VKRVVVLVLVVAVLGVVVGVARWAQPLLSPSLGASWYAKTVYPLEHAGVIRAAARRNGIDPALVAAVIYAESRFDEHARSSQGAVGLMQILPGTAEQIAHETGGVAFVAADLDDPLVNVRYGSYYLGGALEEFDGDLTAAVAAYNAGMGAVAGWREKAHAAGHRLRVSDIPYAETRAYVKNVLRLRRLYRETYGESLQAPASPG